MQIALVHDHYDATKLESVKAEMQTLGAPTIKAVWMECYGVWAALEGCHRIRAAHALGLVPEIEEIEYDAAITTDMIGGYDGDEHYPVTDIADEANGKPIFVFAS